MQKSIFPQKIQKNKCVLQRRACTQTQNFKRDYLENYNDSEHAVKTKNAPFFMIFPNISFFHMIVNYWTGSLSLNLSLGLSLGLDLSLNLSLGLSLGLGLI